MRAPSLVQAPYAAPTEKNAGVDRVKTLKKKFEAAQRQRQPWESYMDECMEFSMPMRAGFFRAGVSPDRMMRVFDETAIVATQEFASRMQAGITPDYARWSGIEPGVDAGELTEKELGEVAVKLAEVITYTFGVLQASNFSTEANEVYQDLAIGTACLRIDPGDAIEPLICQAIPLPQLWIGNGPNGRVDAIYHGRSMPLSHLKATWPAAVLPEKLASEKKDVDCFVVSSATRDWTRINEEVWNGEVLLPKHDAIIITEQYVGEGSCPYIVTRWTKSAGETWGRGPLMMALPGIRVANMVVQLVLENAEMAIAGILTAEDDGVMNVANIKLIPGTIIPIAAGSQGLRRVQGAGDFNIADIVLTDLRNNIRRALFDEDLGSPDQTPKSATEISARMAKQARSRGAPINRQIIEFAMPTLRRVLYILKAQGRVQLPAVNGRELVFRPTSPLAQEQNLQDVTNISQWAGLCTQLFGPQMTNLFIDGALTVEQLRALLGVPKKLARSEEDRAELVRNMQAAEAQPAEAGAPAPPNA